MTSTSQLLIIVAVIAVAHGDTLNITTGPDDYFLAAQRELLRDVELVELQISFAQARYVDRLDTIKIQQQQLLDELLQINQTYILQESLSLVRKHCIQNYSPLLTTYDSAKLQFKACNDHAEATTSSLALAARSYVNSARSHINIQFPRNIAGCNSYTKNQTLFEQCYIDNVELATQTVQKYLTLARDQLETSQSNWRANVRANVKCSFFAEKLILSNISFITQAVINCQKSLSQQGLSLAANAPNLLIGKV